MIFPFFGGFLWFLLLKISHCAIVIPGKECGTKNPIRFKKKLMAGDDPSKLGCTVVEDNHSYREFYAKQIPGKIF